MSLDLNLREARGRRKDLASQEPQLDSDRPCPSCFDRSIPVRQLLLSTRHRCRSCGSEIEAHWLYGKLFNLLILAVTLPSIFVIYSAQGFYAALLLLPLPIGAIGYLKARFCRLQVKAPD